MAAATAALLKAHEAAIGALKEGAPATAAMEAAVKVRGGAQAAAAAADVFCMQL